MKPFIVLALAALSLVAQQQSPTNRVRPWRPSDEMNAPMPGGDITVCVSGTCVAVHATSDEITAIEKLRRDTFIPVTAPSGTTSLQPKNGSIAAHLASIIAGQILPALKRQYPGASTQALASAAADAQEKMKAATSAISPIDPVKVPQ